MGETTSVAEEVKAEVAAALPVSTPAAATVPDRPAPALAVETVWPTDAFPSAPSGVNSMGGFAWGRLASKKSPLVKALANKQRAYIEKFGLTGHVPIGV